MHGCRDNAVAGSRRSVRHREAELSVEKLQRIDDFLDGEVAANKIPGAVVLIQRRDQPLYFRSFGKRDVDTGVPMTMDSIFPCRRYSCASPNPAGPAIRRLRLFVPRSRQIRDRVHRHAVAELGGDCGVA
ncbi:serine hydrolase [Bradyrhizobium sp.]|uniref:serine hydrolase n=1 Tax=Bradyrhizobium sp. TaxID=376 RepID=UPI002733D0EC|nr:serine hydrolase [Bradyrhizobium sp.]MDP3689472.1 serine hydrolase [Bradyrhizobium sp.]